MYEFEDRRELIALTRELLHDGMETEAKNCFEYAERLFHELIERFHNNADEYESENYALARKMGSFEEE